MFFLRHCCSRFSLASALPRPVQRKKIEGDCLATSDGDLVIHPIKHATFVMGWKDKTIYVDPVGAGERFDGLPKPDLVLVTDIHGDHLSPETLEAVVDAKTIIKP